MGKYDPRVDPVTTPPKGGSEPEQVERVALPPVPQQRAARDAAGEAKGGARAGAAAPRAQVPGAPKPPVVKEEWATAAEARAALETARGGTHATPELTLSANDLARVDAASATEVAEAAAPSAPTRPAASTPDRDRLDALPAPTSPMTATAADARLEAIERHMDDNDWVAVVKEVGSLDAAGALPPSLALVAALAHHEVSDDAAQDAIAIAVRSTAALLGVEPDSAIARVVGRRLLRKNPVRFRDRKAPPARVSLLIVVVTLVVGGSVGWLLSGGWGFLRHTLFR